MCHTIISKLLCLSIKLYVAMHDSRTLIVINQTNPSVAFCFPFLLSCRLIRSIVYQTAEVYMRLYAKFLATHATALL